MAPNKGAWAPQMKVTTPKTPQEGTPKVYVMHAVSLLES